MWDDEVALAKLTRLALWGTAALMLWAGVVMLSRLDSFDLREIKIVGAHHVTTEQAKLVVQQRLTGNFFSTDLEATRAAFIKLPWVRDASVRRQWPDGLVVTLEEHKPLARWNDDALLNSYGEVFKAASDLSLPHLSGPAGSEHEVAQAWMDYEKILAPLKSKPVAVTLNDRRSWWVTLDNGMSIALGREQAAERLARWVKLYPTTMASLGVAVGGVDLRYPKGFAVRLLATKPGDKAQAVQGQGKSV
ncbi:cell division protein FtsQ/DivIB [Sulfuriferula thiophila]|uniref:cell division protein FtsQ/DivIB n=1 Tax=Sulfuriferula thiophila TaxID=1781211 RepID=UPI000F615086|nr:cell division protein FtsQ/DivIB [Sulfuriferula thiophila]